MNPKVSVLIAAYNSEATLPECLDSLRRQTLADIEIICVDDGSGDGTAGIIRDYAAKDPRIVFRTQANSGCAVAHNSARAIAQGEYISFVDADDQVSDNFLESLYSAAKQAQADVAVTRNVVNVKADGSREPEDVGVRRTGVLASFKARRDMAKAACYQWNKLYRRDFLDTHRIFDHEARCARDDTYLTFLAVSMANKIASVADAVYYYRYAQDSVSRMQHTRREIRLLQVYRDIFNYWSASELSLLARWRWRWALWRHMKPNLRMTFNRMNPEVQSEFLRQIRRDFPLLNFIPKDRQRRLAARAIIPLVFKKDYYAHYVVVSLFGIRWLQFPDKPAADRE